MVGGVIMTDGVIETLVDGGLVQILMFTWDQLTPPTDTMRILLYMGTFLHMGITDTLHMRTTRTKKLRDGNTAKTWRHLKQGKAIPDPIATAEATGQHFSTSANQVEITPRPDSNPRA